MRDHAVVALVGAACCDDDHLALGLGQAAIPLHQGIVISEERPKFVRPVCERQENVWDEAGFFLHRQNAGSDIFRQLV